MQLPFINKINSPHIQKYLKNTLWLFGDIILRQGITIFVGIYIARYLQPHGLGVLTIATTYLQLLLPVAQLGLSNLVIRDIVKKEEDVGKVMGTAFFMKLASSLLAYIIIVMICLINADQYTSYVLIYSLTIFFSPLQVIDFYFQAHVKAKYIVYTQQISGLIGACLRIIGIVIKADISWFIYCFVAEALITAIFFMLFYKLKKGSASPWMFDKKTLKRLSKEMLPVLMTGFFIALYMRIDQAMIFEMMGSEALGIYSAAVKLCEPFYMISTILVGSLFPAIINGLSISKEEYLKRSQHLFNILTFISVWTSVIIVFLSPFIINIIYGEAYKGAETVLQLYFWASVFVFQGVVASQCFVTENKQVFSTIYTLAGAVINIILNILLIPAMGVKGSALATLISYMFSAVLLNIISEKTRPIFMLQVKAFIYIFQPWKLIPKK